jgi:alkylation response protein AidB-like acyl-CoA dehydrogenase
MDEFTLVEGQAERDLRLAVRTVLAQRCDHTAIAELYDGPRPAMTTALWEALAYQMDLAGLLVPTERGGAGGSARQGAVVMEELGRWVAPTPYLTSAVHVGGIKRGAGDRYRYAESSAMGRTCGAKSRGPMPHRAATL